MQFLVEDKSQCLFIIGLQKQDMSGTSYMCTITQQVISQCWIRVFASCSLHCEAYYKQALDDYAGII